MISQPWLRQLRASCRQATRHYLNQHEQSFMSLFGVTRPQCVFLYIQFLYMCYQTGVINSGGKELIIVSKGHGCAMMWTGYLVVRKEHYCDVIMGAITSQITSLTIVYSTVYSDANQRKHQSSASLAFVRGIHRGPVNFPYKWPVTRKMFPFDDVIMESNLCYTISDSLTSLVYAPGPKRLSDILQWIMFYIQSWKTKNYVLFKCLFLGCFRTLTGLWFNSHHCTYQNCSSSPVFFFFCVVALFMCLYQYQGFA